MKKWQRQILTHYFRVKLLKQRGDLKLTQAKMAEKLFISNRAYGALESGKSCCSALTLAVFLAYYCKDPMKFLKDFREELDKKKDSI